MNARLRRSPAALCAASSVLLLLRAAPQAAALGFRVADQDTFAIARASAFAATADRPSAVYYNPGGVGMLDGQRFHLGTYSVYLQSEFFPADGGKTVKNRDEVLTIPHLYYTVKPEGSPVAFGLGVYAPFGLALNYEDDTPIRNLSVEGSIKYLTFAGVASLQLTRTLSVGAGITLSVADAHLTRGISSPGDRFSFDGSGAGVGFTAGALWKPHPMHSFGLVYRSPVWITFSGHSGVRLNDQQERAIADANDQIRAANDAIKTIKKNVAPFGEAAVAATLQSFGLPDQPIASIPRPRDEEDAHATIRFPQNVVVGYSFRPTPDWNLEINVDWTDWDSLNGVTLDQQFSGKQVIPFNYRSSCFYEFGATRYFANGFSASAGYMFSENSVRNEYFNPGVPDSDRHIVSLGVGYQGERLNCGLAYQFAWNPSRTIDNGTAADGEYQFMSHAISLSVGYKF